MSPANNTFISDIYLGLEREYWKRSKVMVTGKVMKGHVLEREKYKNEYGTGENEIQNMRIRRGLVIEYLNRSWAERDSN